MKVKLLVGICILFILSCNKECPTGYNGKGCQFETRLKFLGWYSGKLQKWGNEYDEQFKVSISSASPVEFYLGEKVCYLKSNTSFEIPRQNDVTNSAYQYEGYGTISESDLEFTITTYYYGDYQMTEKFTGTK